MNCTPGDEAVGQRRLPAQLSGNNANAFLAVPAQFRRIRAISAGQSRGGRTSRDALSNAALRTEKHPNVVNVAASLDIHALRSLRARNEAMLAKSAFIHTLPDKGAMLHDINLRIDERLAILVSSPQPVQPATPSPLSPFKRTPRNPSKPSPSNLEMNGVDADVRELEGLVSQMRIEGSTGDPVPTNALNQNVSLSERQGKILRAGGKLPLHLKPSKIKMLSTEETIRIDREYFEMEQQLVHEKLAATSGLISVRKAANASDSTFDRTKYRSNGSESLDYSTDEFSDDSYGERSEEQ